MNYNQGYFWYSNKAAEVLKQKAQMANQGIGDVVYKNFAQLDDGRIVEFTNLTETEETTALWDDQRLLGHGIYLRGERIQ